MMVIYVLNIVKCKTKSFHCAADTRCAGEEAEPPHCMREATEKV